jgi:tetratricopeptide (TPR) repeat protein
MTAVDETLAPPTVTSLQAAWREKRFGAVLTHSAGIVDSGGAVEAEVYALRGKAFEALHQPQDALAVYLRGLECHPGSARLALCAAYAYTRMGCSQLAIAHFRRAISISPSPTAYRGLLNLEPIDPDSPEAAAILTIALNASRSAMERARACYLLGQISVEAGRDAVGFVYYHRANQTVGAGLDARQRRFQIPRTALAMRRHDFSESSDLGAWDGACVPLIVTGLPRSGKSLVESLLAAKRGLLAGGELAFVRRLASSLDARGDVNEVAAELRLRKESGRGCSPLAQLYGEFAASARCDAPPRYVTDTSPANLSRLGYLALLHPDVPIVFCHRDPLELAVALYFKHFKSGHGYSYGLASVGRAIARAEKLMRHWLRELPNPIATVSYEALVRDPGKTLQDLQSTLGLELGDDAGLGASPHAGQQEPESKLRLFTARSLDAGGAIWASICTAMEAYAREVDALEQACDR